MKKAYWIDLCSFGVEAENQAEARKKAEELINSSDFSIDIDNIVEA